MYFGVTGFQDQQYADSLDGVDSGQWTVGWSNAIFDKKAL